MKRYKMLDKKLHLSGTKLSRILIKCNQSKTNHNFNEHFTLQTWISDKKNNNHSMLERE